MENKMKKLSEIYNIILNQPEELWGRKYGTKVRNSAGEMTDKGTIHSYIPEYEKLFKERRLDVTNVLEIGIGHGGSIKLWNDYFPSATIHAINIKSPNQPPHWFSDFMRITSYIQDAYTLDTLKLFKDIPLDIIIDDGPHTIETQMYAAQYYTKLLKKGGILVIEDVLGTNIEPIINKFDDKSKARYIDLRHYKGRNDDILIIYEN